MQLKLQDSFQESKLEKNHVYDENIHIQQTVLYSMLFNISRYKIPEGEHHL